MDEKLIMDMLGKLLEGQTELKLDMSGMKGDIARLESNMTRMEGNMARMESTLSDKIDALFDGQKAQQDVNVEILKRLDILETKVDDLQLETARLRLVKKS